MRARKLVLPHLPIHVSGGGGVAKSTHKKLLPPYVSTEKIVGGGTKIVTGWGVKIWLQGGGNFEINDRKIKILGKKLTIFLTLRECFQKFPGNVEKLQFFGEGGGKNENFPQILLLGGLKMVLGRGTY